MKNVNLLWKKRSSCQRYIVRKVTLDDIVSLLRLEREVYQGVLQWSKYTFERELTNTVPHYYYLVEDKQEVIAFIGCRLQKRMAHVTNLVVSPRYQHQGIATMLMDKVEWWAKCHFAKTMSLEVRMTNLEAKRLYRKRGYRALKIIEGYYFDNKEDGVYMEKELYDQRFKKRR